ncbi:hypothetical protein GCM10009504_06370 [Pseudomonas laurentiana]|nr:hypothetical protein GCM10009504_06370 [Pseudomonas laurentiana]
MLAKQVPQGLQCQGDSLATFGNEPLAAKPLLLTNTDTVGPQDRDDWIRR